jgi:hypothetical protein
LRFESGGQNTQTNDNANGTAIKKGACAPFVTMQPP